jgi:hypothetical protein
MRYSLRTLLIAMLLGGPGLAFLWWLRHTWSVQVFGILVLMVVALSVICGLLEAAIWLVKLLIAAGRATLVSITQGVRRH